MVSSTAKWLYSCLSLRAIIRESPYPGRSPSTASWQVSHYNEVQAIYIQQLSSLYSFAIPMLF